MTTWREIIGKLWAKRDIKPYAAQPSAEQIANARMILSFAASDAWDKYADYLCVSLGEAMESAFAALRKGDTNAVLVLTARMEAIYKLLTEPASTKSIMAKANQVIITPSTPTRRDS